MGRPALALAHDYLTQRGGAERVVASWVTAWPDAPLFTTLYAPDDTFADFSWAHVHPSALNQVAYFRHHHRAALPLLAPVVSSIRIDADVTLASSSGWAHGYKTTGALAVYCHAPARWLYQSDRYLRDHQGVAGLIAQGTLFGTLRSWDKRAARRADLYIVNSTFTQTMVRNIYDRDAVVVAPPVTLRTSPAHERDLDVLVVARLLPYKNVDMVLDVARLSPEVTFAIVGGGPLDEQLRLSAPSNVAFHGVVSDETLSELYSRARVHLALSHEDFGITPLEAAAAGVPTLARRSGGYLDTITEATGVLIDEDALSPRYVASTLEAVLRRDWDRDAMARHAASFSPENHIARLSEQLDHVR